MIFGVQLHASVPLVIWRLESNHDPNLVAMNYLLAHLSNIIGSNKKYSSRP